MTEEISLNAPATARNFRANGVSGSGFLGAAPQVSAPSAAAELRIYGDGTSQLSWRNSGQPATVNSSGLTAPRSYVLPDISGDLLTQNSTSTLSNKTILSSAGNTVDATRIAGQIVSGSYSAGQVLSNTAPGWAPLTLSATSPLNYSAGNYSVSIGSTSGTVAAGNDLRFSTPQVLRVKATGAGAGEYSTIESAIAAITDSSATKPYVIDVAPGIYAESNTLTIPAYTVVAGSGLGATIVYKTATSGTVFAYSDYSSLRDLAIIAPSPSATAITVNSAVSAYLTRVQISNYSTAIYIAAAADVCALIATQVNISAENGVFLDGRALTGTSTCSANLNAVSISATADGIRAEGPYANLTLSTCGVSGAVCGLRVQDGATSTATSLRLAQCGSGVICGNVGAAPTTYFDSVAIINCTADLAILHPMSVGSFSGLADNTKVNIATTQNFPFDFIDSANMSATILGDLNYRPATGAATTEIGELLTYSAPTGLYTGGQITAGVGRSINVAGGSGYIVNALFPNQYLVKVVFGAYSSPILAANTTFYIYADANGVATSLGAPNELTTVLLGRIRTTASGIEFIDSQRVSNYHPSNNNINTFRAAIGALYATGSLVQGDMLRQLSISSGRYFYLNNEYLPSGAAFPAAFFSYYRSAGVWTRAAATVVDNSQYDDGTNLAPLPIGQFTKHGFYICGEGTTEQYFMVYGQTVFASALAAEAGNLPNPPPWFVDGIFTIAAIIVGSSVSTLQISDLRPTLGSNGGSFGAITDHGNLTGLADDDHTQYLLTNGSRAMSGPLALGGNSISGVSTINSVDIAAHGARHLPNGADPLTTAAPITTLAAGVPNAVGTANSFSRSDHTHSINIASFNLSSLGGTLPVNKGGTGATTLPTGNFLTGNGTSPVLTTKAVPAGVVIGTTDAQVLTNKTITGATNIVDASALQTSGAAVSVVAPPPTSGQVLTATSATTAIWQTPATALPDNTTAIVDSVDPTVAIRFNANGNTATATTIATVQTANQTTTIPNTSGGADSFALVGLAQTLTNKTLTAPIISTISNVGTLTLPTATTTLVGTGTADTLTNKVLVGATNNIESNALRTTGAAVSVSGAAPPVAGQALIATSATIAAWQTIGSFIDTSTFILDSIDQTRRLGFDVQGVMSTTCTLTTSQTANISLVLPPTSGNLLSDNSTSTLTNKTISGATNTVEASALRTTGAAVVVSAAAPPVAGRALVALGATSAAWQQVGDVVGPVSATDNAIARFDGTTGKLIQNSAVSVDDSANIIGAVSLRGALGSTICALNEVPAATGSLRISNAAGLGPLIETVGAAAQVPMRFGCSTDDTEDALFEFFSTEVSRTAKKIQLRLTEGPSGISNLIFGANATYTFPNASGDVLINTSAANVSNKTLLDTTTFIGNTLDSSKRIGFDTSANTAGQTVVLTTVQTAGNRSATIPNLLANDTFVFANTTQTLTNKTLTLPVISSISNGGTITIPAGASTLVNTSSAQTLTNKTLTTPIISSISNGGTITLTAGTYTLTGNTLVQTLTNKSLVDNTTSVVNSVDATKRVVFDLGSNATGATLTITPFLTTSRILTIPNMTANNEMATNLSNTVFFNKTLTDPSNIVSASSLRTATGVVSTTAATTPAASYYLLANSATTAIWGFRNVQRPANITSAANGTIGSIAAALPSGNYVFEYSFTWEAGAAPIAASLRSLISSPAVLQVYQLPVGNNANRNAVSVRRLYIAGEIPVAPTITTFTALYELAGFGGTNVQITNICVSLTQI